MKLRAAAIAVLSFVGMVDSLYLSLKRGAGPIPCTITGGCNDVLYSAYSELAGIPISWFGLAFYTVALSFAVFAGFGQTRSLAWIFWPAAAAFAISMGLVGIQAFVLRAYCEYCLLSAGLVTAIFLLTPRPRRAQPA